MTVQAPIGDAQITNPELQVQAQAPAPVEAAPVAQATPAPTPAPVPEPVKDRTQEQFEKLLDNNKRLFELNENLRQELSSRAVANQTFAPVNLPPVQQPVPQPVINTQDFIQTDPITGEKYIQEDKLQAKIEELNRKTSQAQEAITRYIQTNEQRRIEQEEKEAYSLYPELNPNDVVNHDVKFHNQTRAMIYDSLMNPRDYGGKPLSFREAADFVAASIGRNKTVETPAPAPVAQPAQVATPAPTNQLQGVNQDMLDQARAIKEQASANAQGQTQPERTPPMDMAERSQLIMATRMGNLEAIAKRLTGTDHMRRPDQAAT